MNNSEPFYIFCFEGNIFNGTITNPYDILDILEMYELQDILEARIHEMDETVNSNGNYIVFNSIPSFGFTKKHTGHITLADYISHAIIELLQQLTYYDY